MESEYFFCTDTSMVKYRTLAALNRQSKAPPHLLETLVESKPEDCLTDFLTTDKTQDRECANLYLQSRSVSLAHIEVYLDDFIGIFQGGQEERTYMTRNMFRKIYSLFLPNNAIDKYRIYPISIKKLKKGNVRWITNKTVIGCCMDIAKEVPTLPLARKDNLNKALGLIPKESHHCSKKKCWCLLGPYRAQCPQFPYPIGFVVVSNTR